MNRSRRVRYAAAFTLFLFSFVVWVYVIIVQLTYPDWLRAPCSHVPYPPFNWRLDEVGMLAFGLSAVGFFAWQYERAKSHGR
jgi:hypothetical protein